MEGDRFRLASVRRDRERQRGGVRGELPIWANRHNRLLTRAVGLSSTAGGKSPWPWTNPGEGTDATDIRANLPDLCDRSRARKLRFRLRVAGMTMAPAQCRIDAVFRPFQRNSQRSLEHTLEIAQPGFMISY